MKLTLKLSSALTIFPEDCFGEFDQKQFDNITLPIRTAIRGIDGVAECWTYRYAIVVEYLDEVIEEDPLIEKIAECLYKLRSQFQSPFFPFKKCQPTTINLNQEGATTSIKSWTI